jgi:hypothetical protein
MNVPSEVENLLKEVGTSSERFFAQALLGLVEAVELHEPGFHDMNVARSWARAELDSK